MGLGRDEEEEERRREDEEEGRLKEECTARSLEVRDDCNAVPAGNSGDP